MSLLRIGLLLYLGSFVCVAQNDDLARAARSPRTLVAFLDTHRARTLTPLWHALGFSDTDTELPRGEWDRGCRAKRINADGLQAAVVLLKCWPQSIHVYLHYKKTADGSWRFHGYYAPYVKYFAPKHRVVRLAGRRYLATTEQGAAGTGLSSQIEAWIDLADERFEPVWRYVPQGHFCVVPTDLCHERSATLTLLTDQGQPGVALDLKMQFSTWIGEDEHALGKRRDKVVFRLDRDGRFVFDEQASTLTRVQYEHFYMVPEDNATPADFIQFHWKGWRAVAAGRDAEARAWLAAYINDLSSNEHVRELRVLLTKR